jgi:hypothetical protein
LQCVIQAAAVARDAAADAADINNAHAIIVAQHHKMFLARAFGINPDGTPVIDPSLLPERLKMYKSVKSTAQLFCKATESFKAWQNVTRKVIHNMIPGRIIELRLTPLTQDIRNNWDTTYSVNVFPPAKAFDGEKINATKNRHIPSGMF